MTLRHLKVFAAVCECGSMTGAAEKLNIAQPAISAAISEIEKNYNVVLFERINRRLVITPFGKELLTKAKTVISDFEEFEDTAFNDMKKAKVRIGATMTIGKAVMPSLIKKITGTFPDSDVFVKIGKLSDIEKDIAGGNLDFAFAEGMPAYPNIEKVPFTKDRLAVICGHDYELAPEISIAELSEQRLLLREKGSASRQLLEETFASNALAVTPFLEAAGNDVLISASESGIGVSVLPFSLIRKEIEEGRLREISVKGIKFERINYVITHKSKKLIGIQKKIYDLCFEAI